jgi:hypothetical protein
MMDKPREITYRMFLVMVKHFSIVSIVCRVGGLNRAILDDGLHEIVVEFER